MLEASIQGCSNCGLSLTLAGKVKWEIEFLEREEIKTH